jgi:hypothetical protein
MNPTRYSYDTILPIGSIYVPQKQWMDACPTYQHSIWCPREFHVNYKSVGLYVLDQKEGTYFPGNTESFPKLHVYYSCHQESMNFCFQESIVTSLTIVLKLIDHDQQEEGNAAFHIRGVLILNANNHMQ